MIGQNRTVNVWTPPIGISYEQPPTQVKGAPDERVPVRRPPELFVTVRLRVFVRETTTFPKSREPTIDPVGGGELEGGSDVAGGSVVVGGSLVPGGSDPGGGVDVGGSVVVGGSDVVGGSVVEGGSVVGGIVVVVSVTTPNTSFVVPPPPENVSTPTFPPAGGRGRNRIVTSCGRPPGTNPEYEHPEAHTKSPLAELTEPESAEDGAPMFSTVRILVLPTPPSSTVPKSDGPETRMIGAVGAST
jgi:hypothetical protein